MNRYKNSQQTELCIQYKSNTTLHKMTKTYITMTKYDNHSYIGFKSNQFMFKTH